jgi:methylmalonyl-CoA mutase
MTDLSIAKKLLPYKPKHKLRFVTAASLFDGHDASINIMRRILQGTGAEVIHLGHNRSVQEIVNAALQEDVQGIAITSYQGGHVEFFKYMIDLLKAGGGEKIKVFGGGGGVIVPSEIAELHAYGVARVYSPEDGQSMGLQGMINDLAESSDFDLSALAPQDPEVVLATLRAGDRRHLAQVITALENGVYPEALRRKLVDAAAGLKVPTLGITGTGGAGKSSLTDELVRRFRLDQSDRIKLAIISIDPSRKRTGGALLGDRIRMNAIEHENIYMRSLATRETGCELSAALPEVLAACKLAGFDLVIVETSGIGQGNAAIVPLVDASLYVMTPEFGAASQLEKIDMLDFADFVAINKFDRKGADDALRDVRKQYQRNHEAFGQRTAEMPVFGTMAARFNDDGVTALYQAMLPRLLELGLPLKKGKLPLVSVRQSSNQRAIVPAQRVRYLAEIADSVRAYHAHSAAQAEVARERQSLRTAKNLFQACGKPAGSDFDELIDWKDGQLDARARKLLDMWPKTVELYAQDEYVVKIRDKEKRTRLTSTSLSGSRIRKVSLPTYQDEGEVLRFLMRENVPGSFPFTAGVFAFKRENEDPTRMFAGEGDAFRTNRRFKRVSEGMPAKRLSTAFDSVTLYGCDPDARPDIYGKVGNSGVSIATLDDMNVLFDGFDLCAPTTSVSLTINGPAPIILSMFFNAAIDQQIAKFDSENGRQPTEDEIDKIREWVLANLRGTVQADILKEDQGQNTCIFSTEFALKMMGDIQEFFVHHNIRNFYSVSISGYHIAEAGANPISQLAFTLANGFTYAEAYLARGMQIDDFAPNLSFFFSNGMDPEYSVIGRVARRIWAVAMKNRYGGQRAQPEAQVSHPDVGAFAARAGNVLQRHPHDAAGAHRHLRQLQLAAHQRLRRSDHHADRRIRSPRHGHPVGDQPRVGSGDERESQSGLVHHRRTDRSGRRSGAQGVRSHRFARRRSRGHGNRLSAWQNPGRVATLRAQEARRILPDRRRQYLPQSEGRRPDRDRTGAFDRSREAVAAQAPARLSGAQRRSVGCDARAPAADGDRRRQRFRGADRRCARLLAGADYSCALRRRRPVSS